MNFSTFKILVTAPLDFLPDLKDIILSEMDTTYAYGADRNSTEKLLKENGFDAWLVSPCPTYMINKTLIDACSTLKMISTPSTGSNHIDINYLKEREIKFFSLKGTQAVEDIYASSEFTFNLMISTIRKTPFAFNAVHEGKWRESEFLFRGRELNELTLGIIGFGRIGSNLAKYSLAFGMNILAYDPYVNIVNQSITQYESLNEMLPEADVVAVCVSLGSETYRMINDGLFCKMKDGVYFINTSRGDVIDEDAFLTNLQNGKINTAGLDVISGEYSEEIRDLPLVKYSRTHDNLIITPHIAGLTYDSERKAQTAAYEAIKKYFELLRK